MRPAVFLDRDGTLNEERGFVRGPLELRPLAVAAAAVQRLVTAGYRIVVVTNQSGVARGLYSERDVAAVNAALHVALGGWPDAYLHCPHHPDFAGSPYGRECRCRKPGPGLIEQAAGLLDLDLERSWVVGDSARDLQMSREFPVRRILVKSGKPWRAELARLEEDRLVPDGVCADVGAAAELIVAAG